MAKVLVIGAGVMGLAAAWQAVRNGHEVDLAEAAPEAGGMAAHFDFDGDSIERFYHFVYRTDYPTFELLRKLGLGDRLRWQSTSMGFDTDGRLHPWGNPLALLQLPNAPLLSKLRCGLLAFVSTRRDHWAELENESAAPVNLSTTCSPRSAGTSFSTSKESFSSPPLSTASSC